MVELRTLMMYADGVINTMVTVEHLFEKAIRIKKVAMCLAAFGTTAGRFNVLLTKHNVTQAHEGVGHILFDNLAYNVVTQGGADGSRLTVLDLGNDFIEVEEDGVLYLRCITTAATITGNTAVIIFYEE